MLTDPQLQELEDKHGQIARVAGKPYIGRDGKDRPTWEVVYRRPNRGEYKRFRAMSHNPAQVAEAQETLCRAIMVYPPKEEIDALFDKFPGIAEASGKAISELTSMAVDESEK